MIVGAHVMLQSKNGEADIAFFRDILNLPHVDAGEGFLLFGVPRSEVAVHASDSNDAHKLYLMCDDVGAFIKEMEARGIAVTPAQDQGWGSLTEVTLPGGGALSVYQPHHARPKAQAAGKGKKKNKNKNRKQAGKGKKKGAKAANLAPERMARRAERKAARKAGGDEKEAGASLSPERKAKKESRQAKRAEKKSTRASSASSTSEKKA